MNHISYKHHFETIVRGGILFYLSQEYSYYNDKGPEQAALALSIGSRIKIFENVINDAHLNSNLDYRLDNSFPYIRFCIDNECDLLKKSKIIREYVYGMSRESINDIAGSFLRWGRGDLEIKVSLLALQKNFQWETLCKAVFEKIESTTYYYLNSEFRNIMYSWAKQNPNSFSDYFNSNTKFAHDVRSVIAFASCKSGLVDKRQARRYRSECQSVSCSAIQGMVAGKDNYDDGLFRQCIAQFGDSKHWEVVHWMQQNIPVEHLNVLFGNSMASQDQLRGRIAEYNKQNKEGENNG